MSDKLFDSEQRDADRDSWPAHQEKPDVNVGDGELDTSGMQATKLTRVTLADKLMTRLKQQILEGRLVAGDTLPSEREISEAFGVGRTTVREALQGLVATGFVQRHNAQLIVNDPAAAGRDEVDIAALAARLSVREVYETRKLLEVEMVRLAASHRTEADLAELRRILDAMDAADPEHYHGRDIAFHQTIATMSKNGVLAEVYAASTHLFFRLPSFWRVFGQPKDRRVPKVGGGRHGHELLYEAIAAGDRDRAGELMFEHLDRVQQALIRRIATSQPDAPPGADPVPAADATE